MKVRLLLTLAGLAIGFAVPALAQEQNTVDPEVRRRIEAQRRVRDLANQSTASRRDGSLRSDDLCSRR